VVSLAAAASRAVSEVEGGSDTTEKTSTNRTPDRSATSVPPRAEVFLTLGYVARSVLRTAVFLRTAVLLAYAPRSTAVRSTSSPQDKNLFGAACAYFSDSL